jgi:hypothetical protein
MSDFEKLLQQAQRMEVCHANMQERRTTATLQWFLENDVASRVRRAASGNPMRWTRRTPQHRC